MTLQKAVEILIDLLGEWPRFAPDERREAVNLGIEALKHIQDMRHSIYSDLTDLLPSETES